MRNISDVIEQYLKDVLKASQAQAIEIKRQDIARQFECVPSQINYVINTRFTVEKGYVVESKRGGGGYIRIRRIVLNDKRDVLEALLDLLHAQTLLTERTVESFLIRLFEEGFLSRREVRLVYHLLSDEALALHAEDRHLIRRRQLHQLLQLLRYKE